MVYRASRLIAAALAINFALPSGYAAEDVTIADIIAKCRIKADAADFRSRLDFTIRDTAGKVVKDRHAVYFWKDYDGANDLWSKSILFVVGPPEFKDIGYLRFEYRADSGRDAEQWLYLPNQQRVIRLSERDPRDQTWGVVGDDLAVLQWNEGAQRLLGTEQDTRGTVYRVEIIPKSIKLPYVKVNSSFLREGDGWDRCTRQRSEFIDGNDNIVKVVTEDWARQNNIWYRQRAKIESMSLHTTTEYAFHDMEFNIGLTDDDFTKRMLPNPERVNRVKQQDSPGNPADSR